MRFFAFFVYSAPERHRQSGPLLQDGQFREPGKGGCVRGCGGTVLEPVLAPGALVDGPRGKVTILKPSPNPAALWNLPLTPQPGNQVEPSSNPEALEPGCTLP